VAKDDFIDTGAISNFQVLQCRWSFGDAGGRRQKKSE